MIKQLKTKIFLIIMLSLSILVISVITIFGILNYSNTLKTTTLVMDRVSNIRFDGPREFEGKTEKEERSISIDGVYNVEVKDNEIINNESEDSEIEEYALKIAKTNNEEGIIGKYLYKMMKTPQNTVRIVFMENENTIKSLNMMIVYLILATILSLVIIYWIARKLSETIVKPVEETFEKQKQFISDASHELKTPLAVIEANSDVLENEVGDNKWLKYIQNEITSMDKLINELLLLAKTENVESIKNYQNFDLSKETEMIVSVFESMAYEKKVKLNIDIEENISMYGDKEDIKHILSTLIDNAIKHCIPEKDVTVTVRKEKNEIIMKVKNVGEEIPEEEKDKIFERFYRIDKSRNRSEKRYGLGLAIAKATVEKYNGKIEVVCKDGTVEFRVNIYNKKG